MRSPTEQPNNQVQKLPLNDLAPSNKIEVVDILQSVANKLYTHSEKGELVLIPLENVESVFLFNPSSGEFEIDSSKICKIGTQASEDKLTTIKYLVLLIEGMLEKFKDFFSAQDKPLMLLRQLIELCKKTNQNYSLKQIAGFLEIAREALDIFKNNTPEEMEVFKNKCNKIANAFAIEEDFQNILQAWALPQTNMSQFFQPKVTPEVKRLDFSSPEFKERVSTAHELITKILLGNVPKVFCSI